MRDIARRRLVLAGIMPPLDILQVTLAENPHSILINLRLERQIPILILLLFLPMEHQVISLFDTQRLNPNN